MNKQGKIASTVKVRHIKRSALAKGLHTEDKLRALASAKGLYLLADGIAWQLVNSDASWSRKGLSLVQAYNLVTHGLQDPDSSTGDSGTGLADKDIEYRIKNPSSPNDKNLARAQRRANIRREREARRNIARSKRYAIPFDQLPPEEQTRLRIASIKRLHGERKSRLALEAKYGIELKDYGRAARAINAQKYEFKGP